MLNITRITDHADQDHANRKMTHPLLHIMSPKNKKTSQTSTALYHHVRSHDTKISKPEKHLHETLANAFEAGVRQGKAENEVRVTVNAAELSKFVRKVCEEQD